MRSILNPGHRAGCLLLLLCALLMIQARPGAAELLGPDGSPLNPTVGEPNWVPDRIIVKFRPGAMTLPEGKSDARVSELTTEPQVQCLLTASAATSATRVFPSFTKADSVRALKTGKPVGVKRFGFDRVFLLFFDPGSDVENLVDMYRASPDVVYAEPDYLYSADATPWDPYFSNGSQWALEQPSDEDIDATTAWDVSVGSYSIRLAILDSGIDYNHLDLGEGFGTGCKVSGGYDYVNDDSDPMDDRYHGTHVAGIAAALTKNALPPAVQPKGPVLPGTRIGIAGVAGGWGYNHGTGSGNMGVQVLAMKVLNAYGSGSASTSANAIVEAADPQGWAADVLNCSFGGYAGSETQSLAVRFAAEMGCVLVASKGNTDSWDHHYPSDYSNGAWTISVGATDQWGNRWQDSNKGNGIDVVAPGVGIVSTMPTYLTSGMQYYGYSTDYEWLTGTSMATPHVAGLSALLLSKKNWLHRDDVEQIIRLSAEDKGDPGYDDWYGAGRINAADAMAFMVAPWAFDQCAVQGGTEVSSQWRTIEYLSDCGPIAQGTYRVRLRELRTGMSFPVQYSQTPHVWARGTGATQGWSDANPNWQTEWCGPVSLTTSGAELKTYVHEVYTLTWGFVGQFPCPPNEVVFAVSVLGIPAAGLAEGDGTVAACAQAASGLPHEDALAQNEPNPFDAKTEIRFQMPEPAHVSLRIYDLGGREVATLLDGELGAGYHRVAWEPGSAPDGAYVCKLATLPVNGQTCGGFKATRRMIRAR